MKFTEEKLEQTFIELLKNEGYSHILGNNVTRKMDEVILEDDLRKYLFTHYLSEGITLNEVDSILLKLKSFNMK